MARAAKMQQQLERSISKRILNEISHLDGHSKNFVNRFEILEVLILLT